MIEVDLIGDAPERATPGSSGYDLVATVDAVIPVGKTGIVDVGLRMAIPVGFEMQVRARSSIARRGVIVANGPGTVDSDYRLGVGVILLNLSGSVFEIRAGERIGQGVFVKIEDVVFNKVAELGATERTGGYGSTGV